ncbi:MAG: VWA domain-containing protein [Acidobacteria bacterium]|nr:VWA domain-containing protein [Acidobacteriota bacterium]
MAIEDMDEPKTAPAVTTPTTEAPSFAVPAAEAASSAPVGLDGDAPVTVDEGRAPAAVDAPAATDPAGQSAPASPAAAPQTRAKTKGVADVVFLIDVSGSMSPIIDALRKNIETFVDSLNSGDSNNAAPVRDWRGKVVGYRDIEAAQTEGLEWLEDHPFVRDTAALKAQLGSLQAQGGGDEPESLLDALYKVATMEASPKGAQSEDPAKWRYRSDAARVVVVFTDASFKETMSLPEAKGGALQDVANVVMANRIILSLFAPNFEGYDRLSQIDKSEWEVVEYEGLNAQEALQKFTADPQNFRTTLKQLAASVSRSAETVAL